MKTENKASISDSELGALIEYAREHGRLWKSKLHQAWMTGDYSDTQVDASALQRVRNKFGPTWLTRFNVKEWRGY